MQIEKLKKRDFKLAIKYASEGMNFKKYFKNNKKSLMLKFYQKYFFYLELLKATNIISVYDNNILQGVIMVDIENEKKAYKSFFKKLYVKFVDLLLSLSLHGESNKYLEANNRMYEKYLKSYQPDGEITFFVVNPKLEKQGIGTILLKELEKQMKGKTLYLFTDDQCSYQFYEHRDFIKIDEIDIIMKLAEDVPLKCFLYSKTL